MNTHNVFCFEHTQTHNSHLDFSPPQPCTADRPTAAPATARGNTHGRHARMSVSTPASRDTVNLPTLSPPFPVETPTNVRGSAAEHRTVYRPPTHLLPGLHRLQANTAQRRLGMEPMAGKAAVLLHTSSHFGRHLNTKGEMASVVSVLACVTVPSRSRGTALNHSAEAGRRGGRRARSAAACASSDR